MKPWRILLLTTEWPSAQNPTLVPFLVQQVDFLRRAGVQVDVFSFSAQRSVMNYARAWAGFRRQVRSAAFDLVHAHFGQSALLALPKSLPLVVTFHGSDLQGIVNRRGQYAASGRLLQAISRWVARRADACVLVANALVKFMPPRVFYQVIPCGLDLARFAPHSRCAARSRLGWPQDRRRILFPGSPSNPVKRYSLAQAAMTHLPAELRADLIPLQGVAHDQVPLLMSACDALLLTSLHEGSPTVVKEALACNLPVVSVDVGDVRERVAGLEHCAVCPSDPYILGQALGRVLGLCAPFNGRPAVLDLDETKVVRKLIDLYAHVAAKPLLVTQPSYA
jgi:teichuronic acid biosynthesis glycosyltransferase TuaC